MTFDNFFNYRQSHTISRVLSARVQSLKDNEYLITKLLIETNSIVLNGKLPLTEASDFGCRTCRDAYSRSLFTAKFYRIPDQILEYLEELRRISHHCGQRVPVNDGISFLDSDFQIRNSHSHTFPCINGDEIGIPSAGSRIGQQIVYQGLHAFGSIDGKGDELVRIPINFPLVAA